MKVLVAFACLMSLGLSVVAADLAPPDDPKLLPSLIEKSKGTYHKVNDQLYSVTYHGKEMGTITVLIGATGPMIMFGVTVIDRSKLAVSKNLLLKLAEMNVDCDYAKIGLDKESLDVRIDARAGAMTLKDFEFLENQVATVADDVYGAIKDFLP